MTAKRKCSEKIPDMHGVPNILPCARSATVEFDGRWYCWQHDPWRVKADAEKRWVAWKAEQDDRAATHRRHARNAELAELVNEKTAALIDQLANNTRTLRRTAASSDMPSEVAMRLWHKDAEAARALAAHIREALEAERE